MNLFLIRRPLFTVTNTFRGGILILLLISSLISNSCRHNPDIPQSPILTYNNDISSIILNNCATSGCHDNGHRALTTYLQVMRDVTPGKPYDSRLFTAIIALAGDQMPPQGPLSDPQIRSIYIWILQGAKEN